MKEKYDEGGTAIIASAIGCGVFFLWLLMQRLDMQDCLKLGIGC